MGTGIMLVKTKELCFGISTKQWAVSLLTFIRYGREKDAGHSGRERKRERKRERERESG